MAVVRMETEIGVMQFKPSNANRYKRSGEVLPTGVRGLMALLVS